MALDMKWGGGGRQRNWARIQEDCVLEEAYRLAVKQEDVC